MEAVEFSSSRRLVGRKIYYFPEIGSTNDWMKEKIREGIHEGAVVFTNNQTRGRGRHSRVWRHFKGNIAVSIRAVGAAGLPRIPYSLWIGLILNGHLRNVYGLETTIKWPNDLLFRGRKLAGILCEGVYLEGRLNLILGVGVNVRKSGGVSGEAISLEEAGVAIKGNFSFLEGFLDEIESAFLLLRECGKSFSAEEWNARCGLLGKKIAFNGKSGRKTGFMKGVDREGSLRVETETGEVVHLNAGEINLI